MRPDHWDLAIVGAGPAGATAAISALRLAPGARVLLLDRADFPRDKACGDGIDPAEGRSFGRQSCLLAKPPSAPGGHGFREKKPQHIDLALDVVAHGFGQGLVGIPIDFVLT